MPAPLLQIYKGMRGQKVLCPWAGEQRKGTVLRGARVSGVAPESYSR